MGDGDLTNCAARLLISLMNEADQTLPVAALEYAGSECVVSDTEGDVGQATKHRRRLSQPTQPKKKVRRHHKRKLRRANAVLNVEFNNLTPLKVSDLRDFVFDTAMNMPSALLKKLLVTKPAEVPKVVVAFVPGLYKTDFSILDPLGEKQLYPLQQDSKLLFFYDNFSALLPFLVPGCKDSLYSVPQAFISFQASRKERREREEKLRATKIVLDDLLLSVAQMKERNYPIHSLLEPSELPKGWVETVQFDHDGSRTFALDCEFCKAESGPVLTRISIVNFQNEVVYDTYVKPQEPIIDYVTRYSGITEEILRDVTTTVHDIQQHILLIVSSNDILIGHSLESDFKVMRMRHPRIVDTSHIYDHPRGPPLRPGLKWLAQRYLAREIQKDDGTVTGHLSVEDLNACLDLVKMKLLEGLLYGKTVRETTIFEKIYEKEPAKHCVVVDYNPDDFGREFGDKTNVHKHAVTNDDEAVTTVLREMNASSLILMRLREIDFNSGSCVVPGKYSGMLAGALDENRKSMPILQDVRLLLLIRANDHLQKVYDALPENSLFIVCNEGGDTSHMDRLHKVRRTFQQLERQQVPLSEIPQSQLWDFDKQTELTSVTKETRLEGITFVALKQSDTDDVVVEID